jgi:hypothetical protein
MWKSVHFWLWNEQKRDFKSAEGNGRPSKQVAWSEEIFSLTMGNVFVFQIICDCMKQWLFEHIYMSLHIFKNVSSSLSISNFEILKNVKCPVELLMGYTIIPFMLI